MKTTLNLDDEVFRRAKASAAQQGITLTRFVEEALRSAIGRRRTEGYVLQWVTQRGTSRPAVDPADRQALYELLDEQR